MQDSVAFIPEIATTSSVTGQESDNIDGLMQPTAPGTSQSKPFIFVAENTND